MAQKQKNTATKNQQVVINQIKVAQLNRQKLDIQKWDQALKSAESVTSPKRRQLYELYNNVMIDGQLQSLISKRINAVRTAPIRANCEDEAKRERVQQMLKTPWFYNLLGYIMEARFWGHSLVQLSLLDGEIAKADLVPRHHVVPEKGIIALDASNMESGIAYRENPYDRYLLEVGGANDLGLLKSLAPYVIYKRGNLADYAQFNELFGMPIREYRYDPMQPGSRQEVTMQAESQGAAAYIVMPKGTEIQLHQSSGISAAATFKDFHAIMNEEMAITVLGQNLTTSNSSTGSYSLGQVHQDVQESIHLEDRIWCLYILNWDFKWMLGQLGFDLEGVELEFDDTKRLPVDKVLDIIIRMAPFMPIPIIEVYNLLGLPEPSPEDIKAFEERRGAIPAQLSAKILEQPTLSKRLALLYQDAPFTLPKE